MFENKQNQFIFIFINILKIEPNSRKIMEDGIITRIPKRLL